MCCLVLGVGSANAQSTEPEKPLDQAEQQANDTHQQGLVAVSPAIEGNTARDFRFAESDVEDLLEELRELLGAYHPFAHERTGRVQIDSTIGVLRKRVDLGGASDSLSLSEVYALLATLRTVVGDGHFQVRFGFDFEEEIMQAMHAYDLPTARIDSGAVLLLADALRGDTVLVPAGAEILELDDIGLDSLLGNISYAGLDDHGTADAPSQVAARNLPYFYQRIYGYRDSMRLRYRHADSTRAVFLRATDLFFMSDPLQERESDMDEYLHLDTTALADVMRLHLLSFSSEEYGKGNAKRQIRKMMRFVDRESVRAMIIDVRNNTGGALDLVDEVYSYLATGPYYLLDDARAYHPMVKGRTPTSRFVIRMMGLVSSSDSGYVMESLLRRRQPKRRHHFDGEVIVLTDEFTFSGASILAHLVQQSGRGRVVGQLPGGSAERVYAGQFYQGTFGPGDGFFVRIPLWRLDLVGDTRGNVRPDVVVPLKRKDMLDARDRTLEVAEELLGKAAAGRMK